MKVHIGDVEVFKGAEPTKEYALKPLEEASEVFGAWQESQREWIKCRSHGDEGDGCGDAEASDEALLDECADVIQAVCNLLGALGVRDFSEFMRSCENRNRERGRI